MAGSTIGTELCRLVVGVGCGIEIRQMTSHAGVGRIVVIAVVTGGAVIGNGGVRAIQCVEIIVIGKGGRRPTGLGGMATRTVSTQSQRNVVGIACLAVVVVVASGAGSGRTFITRFVTV